MTLCLRGTAGPAAGTVELDSVAEMLDSAEMLGSADRAVAAAAVAAWVVVVAPDAAVLAAVHAAVQHAAAAGVVAGLELAFAAFADTRRSAVRQVNAKVQLANVI